MPTFEVRFEAVSGAEELDPRLLALPGSVLASRYAVGEIIGMGKVGVVYRARHLGLDRPVAVKVLRLGHTAAEENHFRCEAEMAARLDHPNCVRLYECATHDGLCFIVMARLG